MLQPAQLGPPDHPQGAKTLATTEPKCEPIDPRFLLTLLQALVHLNPSTDVLFLAIHRAVNIHPITDEQKLALLKALQAEAGASDWPPGFF